MGLGAGVRARVRRTPTSSALPTSTIECSGAPMATWLGVGVRARVRVRGRG